MTLAFPKPGKDKLKRAEAIISAWQTEERSMVRGNI